MEMRRVPGSTGSILHSHRRQSQAAADDAKRRLAIRARLRFHGERSKVEQAIVVAQSGSGELTAVQSDADAKSAGLGEDLETAG